MKVETLDAATARRLGIEGERGVVVTQVDPLGPAASVGMRPGDLVVSLQGTPTPDLETFRKTLDEQGDAEGVRIVVVREGMRLFVYLPLSG
jgi:serine protease Do